MVNLIFLPERTFFENSPTNFGLDKCKFIHYQRMKFVFLCFCLINISFSLSAFGYSALRMKEVAKSVRKSIRAPATSKVLVEKSIKTTSNANVKPVFFADSSLFREWLLKHHESEKELWVGFYKKHTGKPTITWEEVVDQCLCFGWIDGIRKSIDDESYTNRITPRNPKKSNWSKINIAKMKVLTDAGLMTSHGLAAFERWTSNNN